MNLGVVNLVFPFFLCVYVFLFKVHSGSHPELKVQQPLPSIQQQINDSTCSFGKRRSLAAGACGRVCQPPNERVNGDFPALSEVVLADSHPVSIDRL